ncbi:MAG: ABC transporter ATP-binding protein, partial [Candidatus Omnitrophica bacterium]|nr:ABC transporter ATP-binding protein [Candidatus Omnitrophota bacterium]
MWIKRFKNNRIASRFEIFKKFIRVMEVKPAHIILPVTLSFIAAFFDGISLGLLIPLAKGVVSDFSFVNGVPILRYIINIAPHFSSNFITPNKRIFIILVIVVFLAIVLKNCISYVSSVISIYWHGVFKRNVHKFMFDRFLGFGKLFFDRTNQGYLTMVLNYSESMMQIMGLFEVSIKSFLTLAVYFVIMFMISWKLTVITFAVFPVLHYALKMIIKKIEYIAVLRNQFFIEMNKNVFNILSCIPLVKA